MSATEIEAWLQEQTAKTAEELEAGDGNDPDEIQALRSFLNGTLSATGAATAITRPVTRKKDPHWKLQSLWGLLADALVEQGQEVGKKSLDLLAAIQKLPKEILANTVIDWPQLEGFGVTWYDYHSPHFHGPNGWESGAEGVLTEERKHELYQHCEDKGIAEASIWLRVPNAIAPELGYDVLDLSRSGRAGLYVLIHQIHGWLKVAGPQLWKGKPMDEVGSYRQCGFGKRTDAPMSEHWAAWEAALVDLSGDKTSLPEDSRNVAADCLRLLKEAKQSDEKIGQVKKFDT